MVMTNGLTTWPAIPSWKSKMNTRSVRPTWLAESPTPLSVAWRVRNIWSTSRARSSPKSVTSRHRRRRIGFPSSVIGSTSELESGPTSTIPMLDAQSDPVAGWVPDGRSIVRPTEPRPDPVGVQVFLDGIGELLEGRAEERRDPATERRQDRRVLEQPVQVTAPSRWRLRTRSRRARPRPDRGPGSSRGGSRSPTPQRAPSHDHGGASGPKRAEDLAVRFGVR